MAALAEKFFQALTILASLAWEESRHNVNVVGHDAPGEKSVMHSLAEAQGRSHGAGDAHVEEWARASATVEVLFDARVAISGKQCFLLGKQIGIVLFGGCQDVVAFNDFCEHRVGERIGEMKGNEVKAFFSFPMRKAAAIANVDFAVTWLHGAVEVCGTIF